MAASILVTSMLGTGITFMQYGFQALGYLGSILFLLAVAVTTFFSLWQRNMSKIFGTYDWSIFTSLIITKDISGLCFSSIIGFFSSIILIFLMLLYSVIIRKSIYPGVAVPFNTNLRITMPFFIAKMICQLNMIYIYLKLEDK
ncbi:MAG: hypothetical protein ACRC42_02930 [Mycoplasma sp.]